MVAIFSILGLLYSKRDICDSRGNIHRFSAQINEADLVIIIGTKRLNDHYDVGHIYKDDFDMVELRAQRNQLWVYIKKLGIITQDGSIIPNMELAHRDESFWNQETFPPFLNDRKAELVHGVQKIR